MGLHFTKMQGIGNDFVVVDTLRNPTSLNGVSELSRRICDRRYGVGADGLIFVLKREGELEMAMLNPDGSLSEMCGNGLRCFAKLVVDRGYASGAFPVVTGAGTLQVTLLSEPEGNAPQISIDMGKPTFPFGKNLIDLNDGFQGFHVSMGNPHLVIFCDNVEAVPLEELGPQLENHPLFPSRTNVHFVQVLSDSHILQRTWERGAGITLACGTGACASVVAAATLGKTTREVRTSLPGGELTIQYLETENVKMVGSAEYVFEGEWL